MNPGEWARCEAWIAGALEYSGGTHDLADVRAMVERGEAQFWFSANAAGVTEVVTYPRFKSLHLWLCGGDMGEIVSILLPAAEAWAKAQGCTMTSTAGRMGWSRVLEPLGYEPVAQICMKELT